MDFNALALECAPWVAPQTMAAIVKTESQFNPLAININAGSKLERQPKSKQEAVVTAKWLLANNYNIDMGLGQVNSANLAKTKLSIEDAFDECKNLTAAASILKWNYQSASRKYSTKQEALHAAISAYNTGSFTRGFNNGYVSKVVKNVDMDKVVNTTNKYLTQPIPLLISNKTDAKQAKNSNKTASKFELNEIKLEATNAKIAQSKLLEDSSYSRHVVYGEGVVAHELMVYR